MPAAPERFVLYAHGFASGPASHKAAIIRKQVEALCDRFLVPDLNTPTFATTTLSAQIGRLEELFGLLKAKGTETLLIGSSMGAYVALRAAARVTGVVQRFVLLSPVIRLATLRIPWIHGPLAAEWKSTGHLLVYHHTQGTMVPLGSGFLADIEDHAARVAPERPPVPVTFVHGKSDDIVPLEDSRQLAALWSARLVELCDGHLLAESGPQVVEEVLLACRELGWEAPPHDLS